MNTTESGKELARQYMTECGYTVNERPDEHHHFKVAQRMFAKVQAEAEARGRERKQ